MSAPAVPHELHLILKLSGATLEAVCRRGRTIDFVLSGGTTLKCYYMATLEDVHGWCHDYEVEFAPHKAFYFHRLLGQRIAAVSASDHQLTLQFDCDRIIIHSRRNLRNPDGDDLTGHLAVIWDVQLSPN
jgi:hypothetical protein